MSGQIRRYTMDNDKKASSTSKKKKPTNSNKTTKTLKRIILSLLLIILVMGFVFLGTAFAWISAAEPLDIDELFSLNQTTYIVDENDVTIDKLHANENRTIVTLDQIPQQLQDAFIAIEDKRFDKHFGIDIYRIFGALKADIMSGQYDQGGSTITQQLIKKVYLYDAKKVKRKVIEMYYAIQLEREFTKDQILQAYLNTIPLGHNVAGVKEAALYYFAKDLKDLTLAESAMLAGITNNPSLYSPYRHFDYSTNRKELILRQMLDQGKIDKGQYDQAMAEEIKLSKIESEVETSYFADMVIADVLEVFEKELGYTHEEAQLKLFNGGLKIVSTIDTKIQNTIEDSFKNEKLFPKSKTDANGTLQPEATAIVIDHSTGQVKAVMGGRSEKVRRGLNRATQAYRQPGSTIKPLSVYAPALDNGYTVASVVDDKPVTYGTYSPRNYSGRFSGLVTIREAMQQSLNIVAVEIVQDIGAAKSIDYMKRMGITSLVTDSKSKYQDIGLGSLALGGLTKGVRPIEMAAAFSVFPNKGVYNKPITFTKIYDKDDNLIYENKSVKERIFNEQVAYLMVNIMEGVVKPGGTGTNATLPNGMPVGGKTGTTTDNLDAWFIGYTPYYTTAVWMGHDEPKNLGFTGGSYPARLWKDIMSKIHKDLPVKSFETPGGLVSVDICTESGKRPSELCALDPRGSTVKNEVFIKGTEPAVEDICDVHVVKEIDITTGKLASPYCPPSLVQSKVFIQRLEPTPADAAVKTTDSIYEAPTEVCPLHTADTAPIITDPLNPPPSNGDPLDPNKPGTGEDEDPLDPFAPVDPNKQPPTKNNGF